MARSKNEHIRNYVKYSDLKMMRELAWRRRCKIKFISHTSIKTNSLSFTLYNAGYLCSYSDTSDQ